MSALDTTQLNALLEISHQASCAIMDIYAKDFNVVAKGDNSPATAADLSANQIIIEGLEALGLGIPILTEEAELAPWDERKNWSRYWLVDPLDGTKEFIRRTGEFTVNIALMEHGEAVVSVVEAPALKMCWFAMKGLGAFKGTCLDDAALIQVTGKKTPDKPWVVAGSRLHSHPDVNTFLQCLKSYEATSYGSSLKFCLIAEGKVDVYPRFTPTSEWDTAAAQCLVECAGGQVVDMHGKSLKYNTKDDILNPKIIATGVPVSDWLSCVPQMSERYE